MRRQYSSLSVLLVSLTTALGLSAQDWPQWRGPDRDGVARSFTPPASWPEQLKKAWTVEVGLGYASPVVIGKKIYQFARQGEEESFTCLDLDTGRTLWRRTYPAPYRLNPAASSHGKGPKSTPVVSGGRVFTLGISGILSAFDSETGELLWRKDFIGQFDETSPTYGTAMSALVDDGRLIAHVGGHGRGALTAFQANTGEVEWSWDGDGPGYASPIIVELGGTRQIVTQSQEHLVGIAAATGKLLWSVPFTTSYVQNIVTPILYEDTLIFSGLDKGIFAIRPAERGGKWTTEKIWETGDLSMYMSSPVLHGNRLFGLSHPSKGQFFCLDARTGATRWVTEGRQGDNAAILLSGDVLFLLTNNGEMILARADDKGFEPFRRYTVAETSTWAHPVVLNDGILIKDESTLTLWTLTSSTHVHDGTSPGPGQEQSGR